MKYLIYSLLLIVLVFSGCTTQQVYTTEKKEFTIQIQNKEENKSIYSNPLPITLNRFAFNLYQKINAGSRNIFISPYSISSALSLAYFGAKENTANQFSTVLAWDQDILVFGKNFHSLNEKIITDSLGNKDIFRVANAIWVQKNIPLQANYLNDIRKYLDSEANSFDFTSDPEKCRETINKWVEVKTNHKIMNFIPNGIIKPATRMVLTNAVYFNAVWDKSFDPKKTEMADFFTSPGKNISVPFMNDYTNSYKFYEDIYIKALEIPYSGEKYSALFILPVNNGGFLKAWDYMEVDSFESLLKSMHYARVDVTIPKFKISSFFSLTEILRKMGLNEAFSPDADFSGMTGTPDLYFDEAIHKTFVEVSEEGTEAAAATGIFMRVTSVPPSSIKKFVANHPFLFIIKENTSQTILFMGQVFNPGE